jgi:hypothetical protein
MVYPFKFTEGLILLINNYLEKVEMLNKFAQTKTKSQAIAIQNPKEATGNILGLRHNSESWQRPNLSQSSSQQMQG